MGKIVITKKGLKSFLLAGSFAFSLSAITTQIMLEKLEHKAKDTTGLEIEIDEGITLSDVYIDNSQLELSKEAQQAINMICSEENTTGDYIDQLEITFDSTTAAYADYANMKVIQHQNSKLYDASQNTINWNAFIEECYKNSKREAFHTPIYEVLTKNELEEKVNTLKETLEKVQEDFPDYDIATLACNLEECSINYDKEKLEGVIARVENTKILYTEETYNKKNKGEKRQTDIHEDIHFIISECGDIRSQISFSRGISGICIALDYNSFNNNCYDSFDYTFLEEIYTELYSCELAGINQNSYMYYDEILSTLQLALGLDNDYQIDAILENLVYKDPISFIKNFKVYGKDKDSYFIRNCQMLKACDILLDQNSWYLENLEEAGLKEGFSEEGVFELQQLALNQMTRNFFNTLIVANEEYKDKISLEENLSLIQLFSEYLLRSSISLIEEAKVEYELQEGNMCRLNDTILSSCKDTMFAYLEEKYESTNMKEKYSALYPINKLESSLNFLSNEKKDYYNALSNTRYDYTASYKIPLQKHK